MRTGLIERWQRGLPVFGLTLTITDPFVAELLGRQSFDFILLDTEHAPLAAERLQTLLIALTGSPPATLLRVAFNHETLIAQALDLGADGVVVPRIETADEARTAVAAAMYPPRGHRGVGPRRVARISGRDGYLHHANDDVVVIAMVESPVGVDHIDDIVNVEGVAAVLVGVADLAASLGHLGDAAHRDVLSAVERIGKACVAADVPYGTHAQSSQRASELLAAGALLLTLGSDVMLLETGSYRVLGEMASLRDGLAQPPTNESGPTRTGVVGP